MHLISDRSIGSAYQSEKLAAEPSQPRAMQSRTQDRGGPGACPHCLYESWNASPLGGFSGVGAYRLSLWLGCAHPSKPGPTDDPRI